MNQPVYVGIDIGTTNTCAYAITQKEVLEQVADENGKTLIRSVVCFCENGEVIVGKRGLEIGFFSSIFGSIIYRYIIAAATKSQIFPAYALKLVSACIVAAALALPAIRYQMGLSKMKRTRERDMCEQ